MRRRSLVRIRLLMYHRATKIITLYNGSAPLFAKTFVKIKAVAQRAALTTMTHGILLLIKFTVEFDSVKAAVLLINA